MRSQFRQLLAQKGKRENRVISIRAAWHESGVSKRIAYGMANDSLREFPSEALGQLCAYLECELGDLLKLEEAEGTNHGPQKMGA